jgi:hypothetical protein
MNKFLLSVALVVVLFAAIVLAQEDTMILTPGGNWELPDQCSCICRSREYLKARIADVAASVLRTVSKQFFTAAV